MRSERGRLLAACALGAALLAPSIARADDAPAPLRAPSDGTDILATGIVLTAIGALSFATAPLCNSGIVMGPEQSSCFEVSFLVGAPFLAAGIPVTIFGALQRVKYDRFVKAHPLTTGLSVAPLHGGGAIGFGARF
jgi:hypothetical protein